MLTCDICGALVDTESTGQHLDWHQEINDAFTGAVILFERMTKTIEALSASLEDRQTD